MQNVILVIHLIISIALVATILLQRSEGGALGIGGGPGGLMSVRGAANLLTRTTAILAVAFLTTSIILAILAGGERSGPSIMQDLGATDTTLPDDAPSIEGLSLDDIDLDGDAAAPAGDLPAAIPDPVDDGALGATGLGGLPDLPENAAPMDVPADDAPAEIPNPN